MHTYIHTYIHTYMHTYIHTYIHAYIHAYIRTCMHTYVHTYIHTHTHTHISDESTCPCGKWDQTTDHIIYDCERLAKERDKLREAVTKKIAWPTSKWNLIQ